MRHARCGDGTAPIADDVPPPARAVLMLVEHAHQRRVDRR
jgi:hypothetical protein